MRNVSFEFSSTHDIHVPATTTDLSKRVLELIENIKYRQLPRRSLDTNSSNSNLSTYYTNFSQVLHDDRPLQRATEIAQSENQYMRPSQAPYTNPHSENESIESPAQQLNETSQSESQYLISYIRLNRKHKNQCEESHKIVSYVLYSRKMYLEEGLSIQKMYRLYLDYCKESDMNTTATLRQYRDIFNAEF
ncbi:unnamed protein product, partial [Callosobruchus maculatus]